MFQPIFKLIYFQIVLSFCFYSEASAWLTQVNKIVYSMRNEQGFEKIVMIKLIINIIYDNWNADG